VSTGSERPHHRTPVQSVDPWRISQIAPITPRDF
jgi:hypothetical protein